MASENEIDSTTTRTELFTCLAKQANSGVTFKQVSPVSYTCVSHGGLPYEAFNALAQVNPWNIFRLVESTNTLAWWVPQTLDGESTFMDLGKLQRLFFTVCVSMKVQPEVYDIVTDKRPLVVRSCVACIGRTSFKYKTDIQFPNFDKQLVNMAIQYVCVDTMTHKPSPPDEWWTKKYSSYMEKEEKPLRVPTLDLADARELKEDQIKVLPSDIDPYMHVNWGHYVKYCMDVFIIHRCNAKVENPFPKVKSVDVNYKGEGSMGDLLNVKWWTDNMNKDRHSFIICKEDQVICECVLEFYC